MAELPEFDPSKPFEPVEGGKGIEFDPSKPFEEVAGGDSWGHIAKDVARQALTRPIAGLENIAAAPAQLLGLAGKGAQYLGIGNEEAAGEQENLKNIIEQNRKGGIRQYLPEPETTAGKYVGSAAEMLPSALAQPGTLPQRVIGGIGAGLGSEAGGQMLSGDPTSETIGRVIGGLAGGVGGALAPGVASGIAGAAGLTAPRPAINPSLGRALARDQDTSQGILQRLEETRTVRPDATLADVGGQNVRGEVERLAQTPGAGLRIVEPAVTAQQKQQIARLSTDLTGATGTRQSAFRAIEDTMAARRTAATPLYQRAYQEGDRAIWSPELERLSGAPFVQGAMRKAVTTWKNQAIADGYGAMNPSQVDRGGLLTFGGSVPVFPNIQFWDYTKRMLDDQVSTAIRAGQNQKARVLTTLVGQLRTDLDRQVPAYAAARNAWSGPSRYMDAIEEGRSILSKNVTAEEWAHNFGQLTQAEQEGTRIGAISSIITRMRANPAKLPDLTRDLRSPDMREKLAAIMPTPEAAQRFNQALDYEIRSSELTGRALGNSRTAIREAMQNEAESILGEAALHMITPHGGSLGFFRRMIMTFAKPVRDTLRSRSDSELAQLLFSRDPAATLAPRFAPRGPGNIGPAAAIGATSGLQALTSPSGFKKGGRVTKTFRYCG